MTIARDAHDALATFVRLVDDHPGAALNLAMPDGTTASEDLLRWTLRVEETARRLAAGGDCDGVADADWAVAVGGWLARAAFVWVRPGGELEAACDPRGLVLGHDALKQRAAQAMAALLAAAGRTGSPRPRVLHTALGPQDAGRWAGLHLIAIRALEADWAKRRRAARKRS